jgi:hypothetical protein
MAKITRLTHKAAIHLVAVPFAVLALGGQSGYFWIHPRGYMTGNMIGDRAPSGPTGSEIKQCPFYVHYRKQLLCQQEVEDGAPVVFNLSRDTTMQSQILLLSLCFLEYSSIEKLFQIKDTDIN